MLAETRREKKERLHLTFRRLMSLKLRVDDCLARSKPMSATDYNALKTMAGESEDHVVQIAVLDQALEQVEEELLDIWAALARERYHDFYEYMNRNEGPTEDGRGNPICPPGFKLSPHQTLIADLLMASHNKEIMRFMLSMPPGHCKSTHSSHHFPAWWFGKNPKKKFLQAGHSQDFVDKQIGSKVKAIVESDDYRRVFPDIRIRSDMKAASAWGLTNLKGEYVAKGVGQGISGFRGNYGMVDDPFKSREAAESQTTRDSVFTWYSDDFTTRLLPGSPLGIIMTRWHSDDICGRITERQRKEALELQEKLEKDLKNISEQNQPDKKTYRFEIINLSAVCEEEDDPLGRQIGEALWTEVYNLDELANLRIDMTASSWNSLYQGTPMDVTGGAVSPEWFRRYSQPPSKADPETNTPNQIKRTTVSVDAANTAKERSDYTVIGVWQEDFLGRHYLIDVIRKQIEFTELCSEIDRVCKRYEADALLVEAKGNGLSYIQLKEHGGAPAPLISIEVGTTTKEFRFDKVSPMFEAGQVYLPERAIWLADYEKELIAFPNGKKDDQVDMTSQYLDWSKKKRGGGTKKMKGAGYGTGKGH
jgi:predicted phage terminase large subunit-like protein